MNKKTWVIAGMIIIFILAVVLSLLRNPEDGWIKNSNGIWVMHGNASGMPDYAEKQYAAFSCANQIYTINKLRRTTFDSQCLGTCGAYAVDMVHVPRTSADDLPENQCKAYLNGTVKSVVEIDSEGRIVRAIN